MKDQQGNKIANRVKTIALDGMDGMDGWMDAEDVMIG